MQIMRPEVYFMSLTNKHSLCFDNMQAKVFSPKWFNSLPTVKFCILFANCWGFSKILLGTLISVSNSLDTDQTCLCEPDPGSSSLQRLSEESTCKQRVKQSCITQHLVRICIILKRIIPLVSY